MEELTARQSEILKLVRELTEVSGYPPTRAEIAEKMGFRSVNAAEQHLRALEKKGAIEISAGSSVTLGRTTANRAGARKSAKWRAQNCLAASDERALCHAMKSP